MDLDERARGDQLDREVAIADGIERVARDAGEAERRARTRSRSIGSVVAGERARAERRLVGALRGVDDPAAIARRASRRTRAGDARARTGCARCRCV